MMSIESLRQRKAPRPFHSALAACILISQAGTLPGASTWVRPQLNEPSQVQLSGLLGDMFNRSVNRIAQAPYDSPFLLADVSFATNRWFTNYSGDLSGRFLELASLLSDREKPQPAALPAVMENICNFQKRDGHFGAEINWTNAAELHGAAWDSKVMPLLWGNGRLLLGLTACYHRFGDAKILQSARQLGDFYATTAAAAFCDPRRTNEYQQAATYAGSFATCYFEGMEGLVQLYRLTRDQRYLDTALRMADFHQAFDCLPAGHSHGSLSQHEALLMLYEETGQPKYFDRAVARWDAAVTGGYVSPAGGVMEKFVVTGYSRDEGCAEADWLRVCLMLWRNTGQTRYLDMAERTVWNEYFANQWADGGFGHRDLGVDTFGPYAFDDYSEEALWCCAFHGPLALNEFKSYLTVAAGDAFYYNFPVDFSSRVSILKGDWTIQSTTLPPTADIPVRCEVRITERSGRGAVSLLIRRPVWAEKIIVRLGDKESSPRMRDGYVKTKPLPSGSVVQIDYLAHPYLENRRFQRIQWQGALPARLDQAVVHFGPNVMLNAASGEIQDLVLHTKAGFLQLPADNPKLMSCFDLRNSTNQHAFVFNVEVRP